MTIAPIAPSEGDTEDPDYSDHSAVAPLFRRFAALTDVSSEKALLRERLILIHLPLAEHLAQRFSRRGEPVDDLVQVARLGLLKAVDRFDPRRDVPFLGFAVPTIAGEIRRYFRDHAWYVRPPRRLQELHLRLNTASTEMFQRDHRAPTARTLAEHLGLPTDEVHEGLQLTNSYAPLPLDAPSSAGSDGPSVIESLGALDEALALVDNREALKRLIADLPERERRILGLRFFDERTQSQIASDIGVSQMQVSRLLSATLTRLRRQILADA
ncbi:SigB/SigF/SigG family RNA polymerase sigma factor [Cryptosporangium arvum]|uniref:RNA polymerase sigma-70 factor, sigma-B/F/G subfamily n=1 Tax=Cryptosporangium arvum DSM 44712 TaxID=927661 RepID=A0A010Z3T3_9ACTN|nr:SigB/SigF/SigG family RNA polymerase sigma factor [Cryptosporangium arvum]EXG82053.1 RNA polymerase sigma-70 factor, sigma-B/F/G subfamily [Cryptosporangium arvum DSM 44712]